MLFLQPFPFFYNLLENYLRLYESLLLCKEIVFPNNQLYFPQSSWLWKLRFLHLHVMHFGLAAFIEIWVYSTLFTLYSYNVNIIWSNHFTFLSLIWNLYKSLLILQRKNKTIFLVVRSQSVRFEKRNASHGSVRIIVSIVSLTVWHHLWNLLTLQSPKSAIFTWPS